MNNYKTLEYVTNNKTITIYLDEENTAYLSQVEIAKLFNRSLTRVSTRIKSIYEGGGYFRKTKICPHKITTFSINGRNYETTLYPLDLVIEIGYKFDSNEALKLKEYLDSNIEENDSNMDKVIIYNNGEISVDVRVSIFENTVWIDISRIATILNREKSVIYKHIKDIFEEGELDEKSNLHFLPIANSDKPVAFYNLDVFISVGYRVKSPQAIAFRKWANKVLKDYIIKGYSLNNNLLSVSEKNYFELRKDVDEIKIEVNEIKEIVDEKVPNQKIFFNGEYFDAYDYLCQIVSNANEELIIIDPYFDEIALKILEKSKRNIHRIIYCSSISRLNAYDIEQFCKQYGSLTVIKNETFHDRFIILDKKSGYHLGASFNYLGKKTFEIDKIEEPFITKAILNKIE